MTLYEYVVGDITAVGSKCRFLEACSEHVRSRCDVAMYLVLLLAVPVSCCFDRYILLLAVPVSCCFDQYCAAVSISYGSTLYLVHDQVGIPVSWCHIAIPVCRYRILSTSTNHP